MEKIRNTKDFKYGKHLTLTNELQVYFTDSDKEDSTKDSYFSITVDNVTVTHSPYNENLEWDIHLNELNGVYCFSSVEWFNDVSVLVEEYIKEISTPDELEINGVKYKKI